MKIRSLIIALSIIPISFAGSGPLYTDGIIKGMVVDSANGTPMQFANITLHHTNDSGFAGGTATGTNGEFILSKLTEGNYTLKISYIGYANKFIPDVKILREKGEFNAGVIKLSKSTYELSETKVMGEKVSEELHLDKKVINVGQNLNASGGTALDVLQNQPSVRVDPDGTVTLRGSSNFTVLINGKPGVLQGADALRQISANMIETIELITNPSAKYDAEGTAGIININLKKSTDYNISGIVNANSGTRDKYSADATLNYNVDGINLTAGLDYRDNAFTNNQNIDRNSYTSAGKTYNYSGLFIRDKRRQYTGRAGIDYSINSNNSLSFTLSSGKINISRFLSLKVEDYAPSATKFAENLSNMNLPVFFLNSTFNYNYKFNPGVNDLAFELNYSNVDLPSEQRNNEYTADSEFLTRNAEPKNSIFGNDSYRREGRAKLNYTHKFSPASTFESGVQTNISYRKFDIENKLYDWSTSEYIMDYTLTNNFKLLNNVYAAFVTYSNEIFGLSFMGGLRSEYMERRLEQNTLGNNYEYSKLDLFPSFSVSTKLDDHQVQLSYSRRVNRPNENLLNPFPFYSDSYISTSGNPHLLPEYINSFELNYQKMFGTVFLSLQNYFRNSYNSLQQVFYVDNGKLFTTFENFAKTNTYGSEISGSLSAEIFRFDPSVNIFGTRLTGTFEGSEVKRDFFNWSARLNTTVTFTPDTRFQISGNYFSRQFDAQSEVRPFLMLNASLRQDLFDKKLSLTLQARNFLRTGYIYVSNKGTNFESSIKVMPEIPVISLMVSYNFNNFKRTNRPTDNIDIQTGL